MIYLGDGRKNLMKLNKRGFWIKRKKTSKLNRNKYGTKWNQARIFKRHELNYAKLKLF